MVKLAHELGTKTLQITSSGIPLPQNLPVDSQVITYSGTTGELHWANQEATGSALEVKDESQSLDSNVSCLDFTGPGIEATLSGSCVRVTVSGSGGPQKSLLDITEIPVDCSFGTNFELFLEGGTASGTLLNPTNAHAGSEINIAVRQDNTGGWEVGFDTAYKFPGGIFPVITPTPNREDLIRGYVRAANAILCTYSQNYEVEEVDTGPVLTILTNLVCWLKADAGITKDGGDLVSNWADQSGNNNDFFQSGGGQQPLWVDAEQAGKPVIRFDGAGDHLDATPFISGSTAGEIFYVLKIDTPTTDNHSLHDFGSTSLSTHYTFTNNLIYETFGRSARVGGYTPVVTVTNWHTYNVKSESGSYQGWQNNTALFSVSTGSVGWEATTFRIGTTEDSIFFDGDIAEVLIYDTALSTGDRNAVYAYLAERWSIS